MAESFDHVLANRPSTRKDAARRRPMQQRRPPMPWPRDSLVAWSRFLAAMARPSGRAAVIHKAEALAALLAACEGRLARSRFCPSTRAGMRRRSA
jgi:tRNA1(Val) A37 N6-methylase TrmN6